MPIISTHNVIRSTKFFCMMVFHRTVGSRRERKREVRPRFLCACAGLPVEVVLIFETVVNSCATVVKVTGVEYGPDRTSPVVVCLMGHTLALYSIPGSKFSKEHLISAPLYACKKIVLDSFVYF